MSSRLVPIVLAVVLAAAALAGGALWLLRDDPVADGGDRGGTAGNASEESDAPTPRVSRATEREHAQARHDLPWPYGDFAEDIAALQRPKRAEVFMERDRIENELGRKLSEPRVTLRLENVTPEDVIAELTREFANHDLNVYTQDPPVDNDPVFERFYVTEVSVWDVIEQMRLRTDDLVTYAITPAGLCVGSKNACIKARIDARAWQAERVGDGDPDDAFDFVRGSYRPSFREAHIGAVVRDVREQTGVEVIVAAEIWNNPMRLSWEAEPMSTLAALRQIAIKCGGALYAKDGRVFLLQR